MNFDLYIQESLDSQLVNKHVKVLTLLWICSSNTHSVAELNGFRPSVALFTQRSSKTAATETLLYTLVVSSLYLDQAETKGKLSFHTTTSSRPLLIVGSLSSDLTFTNPDLTAWKPASRSAYLITSVLHY